MRILVDADGCPVKQIVVSIAKEYQIPVLMFTDTSHIIADGYSQVITVGQGKDAVDMALINRLAKEDIVVTQDYGLASMVLAKGAAAINQNGFRYTEANMDKLLFERFLSQKVRRAGGKTTNAKKRTKENDQCFTQNFLSLVKAHLAKNTLL